VSYEDLWQANEEKDVVILELQQVATAAHTTLESEKKQVKGELLFLLFVCWLSSIGIHNRLSSYSCFQACGRLLGRRRPKRRRSRRPTTPPSKRWKSCGPRPSRHARALRKAKRRSGAPWRVASVPWEGMLPDVCAVHSTWGSRKPLAWWRRTTGSTSRRSPRATSSPRVSTMRSR
jgi:hypothetical protein